MNDLWSLVLAAGQGSRMGALKQILPIEGTPMVVKAIETLLGAGLKEEKIVVITGCKKDIVVSSIKKHYPLISYTNNDNWENGMFSSIQTGIRLLAEKKAAKICLALSDQPSIDSSSVKALLLRSSMEDPERAAVFIPTYHGKRGHPIIIGERVFNAISSADSKNMNLQQIIEGFPIETVEIDDMGILLDIDYPKDIATMRRFKSSRKS